MSKWSKYILFAGWALGGIVAGIAVYAALDHNPQEEFTNHPENLIPIFAAWMATVFCPFMFIAAVVEVVGMLKEKSWSRYILVSGVVFGLAVGGFFVYAAWDRSPLDLLFVFLPNAGGIALPFAFIAVVMELISGMRREPKLAKSE